jgi:uncharacterized protein (TIGR00369 family)
MGTTAENPDFETLARMVVASPFHRWLGVRLSALAEDHVELELPWRPEFVSVETAGYTHGGILGAFVDIAADYAIAAKLGRGLPTVDMRVDFHRPAMAGTLTARANVLKLGATLCSAEARIFAADGALVASGRGVYLSKR